MSKKEDIQRQFEVKVRLISARMGEQVIQYDGELHTDYDMMFREAVMERDKALKELYVRVGREHLQVLTDWFVKAVKGCKQTHKGAHQILGRTPSCFGTGHPGKYCVTRVGWGDALCRACIAISPLLKDDCNATT